MGRISQHLEEKVYLPVSGLFHKKKKQEFVNTPNVFVKDAFVYTPLKFLGLF